MARSATAQWNGTLKGGDGTMTADSGAFEGPYTFKSRFEEGTGTNPEELVAAAHAGCFSMALSAELEKAGTPAESVETQAKVQLRPVDGVPTITKVDLVTRGRVPGIDQDTFAKAAEGAKENCIISRALGGVDEMTVDATLV